LSGFAPPAVKGLSTSSFDSPLSDARTNENEGTCINLDGFSPKTASAIANLHNSSQARTRPRKYGVFTDQWAATKTATIDGTKNSSHDTLPFIAPPELGHVTALDIRFMQLNGCFDLPPMPILNELVRVYFLHAHPIVPLLDEGDFWDSFSCSNGEKISLLLFQAMIFAACAVSPESICFPHNIDAVISLTNP
jgi:hypothetical protein